MTGASLLAVWLLLGGAPEPPDLSHPATAVAYLLSPPRAPPSTSAARWDGSLSVGMARVLFAGYRLVLSSQDMPACAFTPSCSRFSQAVVERCGLLEGALLSADRLLRDHPLAGGLYPEGPDGKLADEPSRYCRRAW